MTYVYIGWAAVAVIAIGAIFAIFLQDDTQ